MVMVLWEDNMTQQMARCDDDGDGDDVVCMCVCVHVCMCVCSVVV